MLVAFSAPTVQKFDYGLAVSTEPAWRMRKQNYFSRKPLRTTFMSVFLYELDGPAIESRCGAISSAPVQTGSGAHPAYYTMGTWCLSRGKAVGVWRWLPTSSSAEVKERVELYIISPSWPVLGWILLYFVSAFKTFLEPSRLYTYWNERDSRNW